MSSRPDTQSLYVIERYVDPAKLPGMNTTIQKAKAGETFFTRGLWFWISYDISVRYIN